MFSVFVLVFVDLFYYVCVCMCYFLYFLIQNFVWHSQLMQFYFIFIFEDFFMSCTIWKTSTQQDVDSVQWAQQHWWVDWRINRTNHWKRQCQSQQKCNTNTFGTTSIWLWKNTHTHKHSYEGDGDRGGRIVFYNIIWHIFCHMPFVYFIFMRSISRLCPKLFTLTFFFHSHCVSVLFAAHISMTIQYSPSCQQSISFIANIIKTSPQTIWHDEYIYYYILT